ncbi:hypothetical protein [Variovorax sp. IB41]|uniref:hypothetical protein n=1 Tax=Variovorax sp. IB41 TaxID=2779370 RepID=UPI0018E7F4FB|nr:hypothetical protein [Variovorax sp. IB41]MBJ2158301.1 hypothetical protein [Variovorax sp. IB41]
MPAALVPIRLRSAVPAGQCEKIRPSKIEKHPGARKTAPRGLQPDTVIDATFPLFTEICHDTK